MSNDSYYRQVDQLLSEDVTACRERERTTLDQSIARYDGNLVIFGAGRLGRKLLGILRAAGKEPLAFADNNTALWNNAVDGVLVYPPAEAGAKFGGKAVFVVAIFAAEASGGYEDRVAELRAHGCQRVIPFGYVLWQAPDSLPHWAADLPSRVLEQKEAIRKCADLWSDAQSRDEYVAQLRWRLWCDFEALSAASHESQYFPSVMHFRDDESFVDCGAYDGDTLSAFMRVVGGQFSQAICFEPDPVNFRKLRACVNQLPSGVRDRIEIHQAAVADAAGELRFSGTGDTGARIGEGDVVVKSVSLDIALARKQPTYIKMDVEGAELLALTGARGTIERSRPALAVCAYHTPDHLWRIPLLIHSMRSDYDFFLRAYKEVWELVSYAIPPDR